MKRHSRPWHHGTLWFLIAAVCGVLHGGFSLYWGLGGTALLDTLGKRLVDAFADVHWLLIPVGVAKVIAALTPALLAERPGPARTAVRRISWAGAVALLLWGGINTVTGQLVLSGIIHPASGYDRAGMIGHAWLWDPLFLLWGVCLVMGLARSRPASRS